MGILMKPFIKVISFFQNLFSEVYVESICILDNRQLFAYIIQSKVNI